MATTITPTKEDFSALRHVVSGAEEDLRDLAAKRAATLAAYRTAATTQRGGDVHIHVAAGAVVNQIAPGHGHDPKTIADELPSTTRPTLHQLGTP